MAGDRPALLGLLLYLPIAVGSTLVFWVALRALPAGLRAFGERRVALQPAYDEKSPTVCDQVGAHSPLTEAVGRDRAFTRLQTEAALEDAGIVIDPPVGGAAAA